MTIRQWFSEIGNPTKRCARLGHAIRTHERSYYRYPSKNGSGFFGGVADIVHEERRVCTRCNAEIDPWKETDYTCLTGISLPSDDMRTLKKTGRLNR